MLAHLHACANIGSSPSDTPSEYASCSKTLQISIQSHPSCAADAVRIYLIFSIAIMSVSVFRLGRAIFFAAHVLLFGVSLPIWADQGTFIASQSCPAYVSKNKETNPGQVRLQPGEVYAVKEILGAAAQPSWLRMLVQGAPTSELRWVNGECGRFSPQTSGKSTQGATCSTAGQADSYVFAVSWQAAFCETHAQKPECSQDNSKAWSAKHFTLHGLWPNKTSCGTNYGFCGGSKAENFCAYQEPNVSKEVFAKLGQVMPSAAAGSCLQRHEWYKHGTCQVHWDANGYFSLAIKLTHQFNDSGIAVFMQKHQGGSVKTSDFIQVVDQSLGKDAHTRMKIICTKAGELVDIYMNLPRDIPANPDLKQLLSQGTPAGRPQCGEHLSIPTQ